MTIVLDASALLAMLKSEPGGETVAAALPQSVISSVNWAEVVQKMRAREVPVADLYTSLARNGLQVEPFEVIDAEVAAELWILGSGLSLADRACLALGMRLAVPVWTTDRYWATVASGAEVQVIR